VCWTVGLTEVLVTGGIPPDISQSCSAHELYPLLLEYAIVASLLALPDCPAVVNANSVCFSDVLSTLITFASKSRLFGGLMSLVCVSNIFVVISKEEDWASIRAYVSGGWGKGGRGLGG
jgi:hypothetical protein